MVRREPPDDRLVARLIEAREAAGLTPAEAARRADCAPVLISRYEKGERRPAALALRGLAQVYGCTYTWLKDGITELVEPTEELPPSMYDLLSEEARSAVDQLIQQLVVIEGRSVEQRLVAEESGHYRAGTTRR